MSAPRSNRKAVYWPAIFLIPTTVVCGALAWLVLAPAPPDALAELKSLTLYPGATSVSYKGNAQYEKIGVERWGNISSARQRALDITVASMTFETGDMPNAVEQFYNDQILNSGYYRMASQAPNTLYFKYETPYQFLENISDLIIRREVDHPVTFYDINLTVVEELRNSSPSTRVTHVLIELRILRETGGLR
jgi:hypothetical protein